MITDGWLSITSALDRSTRWPEDHMCSARADAATSPFRSAVDVQSDGALRFGQTV